MYDDHDEDKTMQMPEMRSCLDATNSRETQTMSVMPSSEVGCASLEREQGGTPAKGWIYFVETSDGQFIKIGYSRYVIKRMSELGTLRPGNFELRPIGYLPGDRRVEAWLHRVFAEHRDNGEWFQQCERIRNFIETLGLAKIDFEAKRGRKPKVRQPKVRQPEPEPEPESPREIDGMGMCMAKNEAASSLAARRWKKTTKAERSEVAKSMNASRWANATPEERKA